MKTGGFNGTVTNASLHDIVQLICIGRKTCRMQVASGEVRGSVYFRAGEIIHAEHNGTTGEEAFYDILSWEFGSFECDESSTDDNTIQESWDFLLMESMRRMESSVVK